jgi:NodT family efflux transporter outer membrane factor (OMF) lipoprotein
VGISRGVRSRWRHLPLAALCLLSACTTLGPDFREPSPEWLASWQPALYEQLLQPAPEREADLAQFWRGFGDPTLDQLVRDVLADNRQLQIAGLRILEARARLGGARALKLPQSQTLDGSAAWLRQRQSDGLLPASDDSFRSYDAAFNVGWELDFWGRFQRAIESADAAYLASVAAQRDVQVLLVAQTAGTYYAWLTTRLRIDIARRNAAIQKRSFEITQQLYDSGQESELDLQQARTQYLATLASIPDLERSLIQQRNALALLLGRAPGPIEALAEAPAALPSLPLPASGALPAQLLLQRPDVRASAWQAAAQSAQIGMARADFYPAISLFGSFGWTGDSLDVTRDGTRFAAGPALSWNLFDYGRIRANVRVQDARLQQALLAFDATLLGAAREVDDAAIAVLKTAEGRALFADSRRAAERALELANSRYREGYADFQRVLDAQRALFSQAERELLNDSAHVQAVVDFYRALGGGWQPATAASLLPPSVRDDMRERVDWGELLEEAPAALPGSAVTGGSSR